MGRQQFLLGMRSQEILHCNSLDISVILAAKIVDVKIRLPTNAIVVVEPALTHIFGLVTGL